MNPTRRALLALLAATGAAGALTLVPRSAQAPPPNDPIGLLRDRLRTFRTVYMLVSMSRAEKYRRQSPMLLDYILQVESNRRLVLDEIGIQRSRWLWNGREVTLSTDREPEPVVVPVVHKLIDGLWRELRAGLPRTDVVVQTPDHRAGWERDNATWVRLALPMEWARELWVFVLVGGDSPGAVIAIDRSTGRALGVYNGSYEMSFGTGYTRWDVPLETDAFVPRFRVNNPRPRPVRGPKNDMSVHMPLHERLEREAAMGGPSKSKGKGPP